ncbi:MAG: plastocyanin/azurin family copper-binding protein [Haloferacaceae archaeon]
MESDVSRRRVLAGLGVAVAGTAGCLGGSGGGDGDAESPPADATVRLTPEEEFHPASVRVGTGGTVRWSHEGRRLQTVTAYEDRIPPGADYFASGGAEREVGARILYPLVGSLERGDQYRHTFDTPGEYAYFSIPSEGAGMTGRVVVE